jgi:hypothetical protein
MKKWGKKFAWNMARYFVILKLAKYHISDTTNPQSTYGSPRVIYEYPRGIYGYHQGTTDTFETPSGHLWIPSGHL